MTKIRIHQIFYDDVTYRSRDTGFIPLDNTMPKDRDWYEFNPIIQYLSDNQLEEDAWYGFLSPKFSGKVGLTSEKVIEVIQKQGDVADAFIFSPSWDQICYFRNPWEQGEIWHPGISTLSQEFFDHIELRVNIHGLVTSMRNTVFSNYIIARANYWTVWLEMANAFSAYVESSSGVKIRGEYTRHGSVSRRYAMKTFIQERFATVILSTEKFATKYLDSSEKGALNLRLFDNSPRVRRALQLCDYLKAEFLDSGNDSYLKIYEEIRNTINFSHPFPG